MANRVIQQKILKKKRRGRFARFSGSTTRIATRLESHVLIKEEEHGRNVSEIKSVEVYIGPKSFSNQVINTGRGPNKERMQTYYDRITSESKQVILPEDLGIKDPRYAKLWAETPEHHRLNIATTANGRMDMWLIDNDVAYVIIVDLDYKNKIVKMSKRYENVRAAKRSLEVRMIIWEETFPLIETPRRPTMP